MEYLPYARQWLDEDDIRAVTKVLTSDWLTTGPKVKEFEEKLARRVGARYAVVLNSGTAALHAAYFAAGVRNGDEIITSPITFAATANAALYLGARPVFVDIEYDTGNLDPLLIEEAVSTKTRVIAPVDFTGRPAEMDAIMASAQKHNLVVVEDAAHALGAVYKEKNIGSIADMTIFSFHPVKHITTGEGGAVATDSPVYYQELLKFRSHGITKEQGQLAKFHGDWYYEMQTLGYNYRMTDIQCALGISQLDKLDSFVEKRRRIAGEYREQLAGLTKYLELPGDNPDASWHLYVIKVKSGPAERKRLYDYLHARRIGVQVHYLPVYWHSYYRKLGYKKGLCPRAEEFYSKALSLPIFPKMTGEDVDRVCEELYRFFEVSRK